MIAALVVVRSNGWLIPETASVEMAMLVVSLAAFLSIADDVLMSRSISDPIGEVVDAMAAVEQGRFETDVAVFERFQIGRLQIGFNGWSGGSRRTRTVA